MGTSAACAEARSDVRVNLGLCIILIVDAFIWSVYVNTNAPSSSSGVRSDLLVVVMHKIRVFVCTAGDGVPPARTVALPA
jgi:hypothetical protein